MQAIAFFTFITRHCDVVIRDEREQRKYDLSKHQLAWFCQPTSHRIWWWRQSTAACYTSTAGCDHVVYAVSMPYLDGYLVCTQFDHTWVEGMHPSLQTWGCWQTEFCAICIGALLAFTVLCLDCLQSHIAYYFNCLSTTMNSQTLAPARIAFCCWQLHTVVGMTTMLASWPDQSNKRCCKCAMNDVSTRSYAVVILTALGCVDTHLGHTWTAGIQACRGLATSVWTALPLQVDFIRYNTKVCVSRLEIVRDDM